MHKNGKGVMAIQLTEQQHQAIEEHHGQPVEVVDPVSNRLYVLVAAETFDRVRPLLEPEEDPPEPGEGILPGIFRSQQGFWRNLPELLKKKRNRGKWAAYRDDELIGIDANPTKLFQAIHKRGISGDEYYMGRIEPDDQAPWETIEVEPNRCHHCGDFSVEP